MGNAVNRDKIRNIVMGLDPDDTKMITGKSVLYWILDEQYIGYVTHTLPLLIYGSNKHVPFVSTTLH